EPRAGDDDETRSLRATLYGALATAGDAEVTAFARRRVEAYLAEPATVDPALAAMAFRVAPKRGDAALFDAIAGALANPVSSDAESQYLTALPRFEDPALVERALRFVDEGRLKLDEYPSYFASLIANPAAQPRAWRYLKEHWSELAPKVVSFGGRGAVPALGAICTAELEAEVREFFAGHAAPGAERALAQALERIRHCLDFRAAQSGRFHAWLGAVSSADRSR
ncbi:MAG TPA: ERAP1-like C-terminal domain-containing protein, partial [Thermoanaerobaculia bacterium]|nr:ERAP1-like C-terminal domain-containing protein [Thermoanaerobaculia bacterium]